MSATKIKVLTFEQYLNLILRVAEYKEPEMFKANSKKALFSFVETYFVPLLEQIENALDS
jgi:hypothetical protein